MGGSGGNFSEQSSGNQNSGNMEGPSNRGSTNQSGITVPDFLPPAQRVLFMRIQQKQQEEEERARRLAEGGPERDNEGIILPHLVQKIIHGCHTFMLLKNREKITLVVLFVYSHFWMFHTETHKRACMQLLVGFFPFSLS